MGNFVSKCFSTTKNEKKTNTDLSNIAKVNSKTSENNLKESTDKKQAINSNLNQKEIVLM